jgi:hypothetical protein
MLTHTPHEQGEETMARFQLKIQSIFFAVAVLSILSFVPITSAFARPDFGRHFSPRHEERWDFHRPYPFYHRNLPAGYIALRVAEDLYYYFGGIYYRETPVGYVEVIPPAGVVVETIPVGYKIIPYGNTTYYYYDRVYYEKQPTGYTVVTPPPQAVAANAPAVEAPEKSIIVQVPNPNGSFVPVTLYKYSDGYVGPKGEHYADYPTVDQLKAMYSVSSASAEPAPAEEELSFDVPNANGSFTKVTLLKSKDGYVGPEGEFYPKKPTMEQLKVMYSKG